MPRGLYWLKLRAWLNGWIWWVDTDGPQHILCAYHPRTDVWITGDDALEKAAISPAKSS